MNQFNRERIDRLRADAVDPPIAYNGLYLDFFLHYEKNTDADPESRYAQAFAYMLDRAQPSVDAADELIVGKPRHAITDPAAEAEWARLQDTAVYHYATHMGQDSHMAVDYYLLLEQGIDGILRRIDGYLAAETDEPKRRFYLSCRTCLEAVCRFSDRHAALAASLADACADEGRRAELRRIAAVCARVPRYPAENFYEAVQSVSFLSYCLSIVPLRCRALQQFQLGRPDRYLLPYYERDMAAGRLDKETAQLLLDCMAIQIDQRVPHGLSCGYMVGGRDQNGRTVANDLTEMAMQVVDDIRLVYPAVGLCHTADMPERILHKACEILSHGRSHPAIFNDDVISAGLRSYGVLEPESHEYIHSTCVEITPVGASDIWVASPYTNMPGLLLDLMGEDYPDFDSLLAACFDRLDDHIRRNFEEQVTYRHQRQERGLNPLLSCFVHDCLERGRDIEHEGARYNWIMPSFVGMANLVDSLYAVKRAVYDEKWLTMDALRAMLARNFEGNEPTRLRLLNGIEKYGNDVADIDCYFGMFTEHIVSACRRYEADWEGFRLVPSVFCWIMHELFGRETGATPDGRLAGFPLGDGSGPCQGREHSGPTASIISSTGWKHGELIGGVAVNMKFSKRTFTSDSCRKMEALIGTYLERGGFEIQINVVDRETLLAAQREPENYRDLVVRIGGYSDYFVTLSPQMQAEVLLRTSHEI